MKNKLIQLAVRILKRVIHPSPQQGPRKILVVTTTAMGDTLWATPALESLRKTWPDAQISVLTSPIGEAVLRHNPWTNQIFILQEPLLLRLFSLWRTLKKERFQEVLILHASQRLVLPLCNLLGAHRIVGNVGFHKGLDSLLTEAIPHRQDHEIIRRLKLIEQIGAQRHTEKLSFFLQESEQVLWPKTKSRVLLHPGSKDPFRRYPVEHFIQVGQTITQWGAELWVSGTPHEMSLIQEIVSAIAGAQLVDPTLSFRQFAAKLKHFDLLITNDTGPVHLASALDVPVIAIYAPSNPALFGPHQAKRSAIIAKPATCEPCLKRSCRRPFCFLQIGPDEVLASAKRMLSV
jgi:heptosyltransferase II